MVKAAVKVPGASARLVNRFWNGCRSMLTIYTPETPCDPRAVFKMSDRNPRIIFRRRRRRRDWQSHKLQDFGRCALCGLGKSDGSLRP